MTNYKLPNEKQEIIDELKDLADEVRLIRFEFEGIVSELKKTREEQVHRTVLIEQIGFSIARSLNSISERS